MSGESLVHTTVDTSILVQLITGIIAIQGLSITLDPMHKILTSVLGFEMTVQAIELLFYIFVVRTIKLSDMAMIRYYDWFITTPVMLITSVIYYKYQEYLELFEKDNDITFKEQLNSLTVVKFLKENKSDVILIVFFNFLMLLFGYLGETGAISLMTGFYLGTAAFVASFYIIYNQFAKKSKRGKKLFTVLSLVWSLYGIAYLLNNVYKNTMLNGLDIVAKNFFGLYLYYTITSKTK